MLSGGCGAQRSISAVPRFRDSPLSATNTHVSPKTDAGRREARRKRPFQVQVWRKGRFKAENRGGGAGRRLCVITAPAGARSCGLSGETWQMTNLNVPKDHREQRAGAAPLSAHTHAHTPGSVRVYLKAVGSQQEASLRLQRHSFIPSQPTRCQRDRVSPRTNPVLSRAGTFQGAPALRALLGPTGETRPARTQTSTLAHLCVQLRGCHGDHALDPRSNLGYEPARCPRCVGDCFRGNPA